MKVDFEISKATGITFTTGKTIDLSKTLMIDLFTILTSGGIVLFQKPQTSSASSVPPTYLVDQVISNVFMQERSNEKEYEKDGYTIKWTFANELGLIFVAVYQKILELTWVDELLASVKRMFVKMYADMIRSGDMNGIVKDLSGPQCHFGSWLDGKMGNYESIKVHTHCVRYLTRMSENRQLSQLRASELR